MVRPGMPEGKTVKNRPHLDLKISGGWAVPLAVRREPVTHVDPERNEFCVEFCVT